MIEKLTEKQIQAMPRYVEKWLKIGLSTETLGLEDTKKIMTPIYTEILKRPLPKATIIMPSPLSAYLATVQLAQIIFKTKNPSQVESQVESQVADFIWPYLDGHFLAGYFAFYDFLEKECGVDYDNKFLWNLYRGTTKMGLVYPIGDFCVVSAKPKQIHLLNGRIHSVNGPAIEYPDMSVYALNGVRVSEEIVKTPAEQLDPKIILSTTNAEVRREIVRKIGVERLIVKLGAKSLDKSADGVYELLDINLGDGRTRPYLKMRNPSINTWHVEGVHPTCKTVAEALAWRNQTKEAPAQLS